MLSFQGRIDLILKKTSLPLLSLLLVLLAACSPAAPAPRLGVDAPLRIMPLGDSITEGLCDTPENCMSNLVFMSPSRGDGLAACQWSASKYLPNLSGYRAFLKDRLLARGLKMSYVGSVATREGLAHEGHAAWTIADLDFCVQHGGWLESAQPNLILLHIGTNDASYGRTPDEMAQSLQDLLEDIYRKVPASTEVIVAQILPARRLATPQFAGANLSLNEIIAPYNQRIPAVVRALQAEQKYVTFVDMTPAVQSDSDLDSIGIHPNPAASRRMAEIWYGQILKVIGEGK